MKLILSLLICICVFSVTSAQKGSVKGMLSDTVINNPVAGATITLMKQKDSSLVSFSMTDDQGRFEINGISNGSYRLLITHANYHNKSIAFTIDAERITEDLKTVVLHNKTSLLADVVVTSEAPPVTLIGDTVEYNARSFKTIPNASVEDLLKKLPGVQVDKDGTVKAQGEKVNRVLVDGKEFFGSDPKMATKNLPADAIDKVQVYDRLSDQAQLTGFDDGNSEKTINLKLKKDRKKGKFGKATAGYGTDDRFEGRFNINSFKGARQMSAIGLTNNINAEGFSFMDLMSFTGALNQMRNNTGGNMSISIGPDDPLAGLLGGNNTGITTTKAGGLNYNNIIGTKTDWQSNYFFSQNNPVRQTNTGRQYFDPVLNTDQRSVTDNIANTHRVNITADHRIDSFHSVKLTSNIGYQKTSNSSLMNYNTYNASGKINEGGNNSVNEKEGSNVTASLLFRKKFKRAGRTFSVNFSLTQNSNEGTGSLTAVSNVYDLNGNLIHNTDLNQRNTNEASLKGRSVRVVYTEPLFKKSLLEFSYAKSVSNNSALKTTMDFDTVQNKYSLLNDALSNDYENSYDYTNAGVRLRKRNKGLTYSIGASWQEANLSGNRLNQKDSSVRRTFTDLLPSARAQYTISRSKNLILNYTAFTREPTISQLQPVADNSNSLYIPVGNPELKQEYIHSLSFRGSYVNPFKNKSLFINMGVQSTHNKIENSEKINSIGVDSVMPVNVNGVYNLNADISYSFPIKIIKASLEVSTRFSKNHTRRFLNGQENILNSTDVGPQLTIYVTPDDKIDFSIGASYTFSSTKYSLPSAADFKFMQQEYNANVNWQLPAKFLFTSDLRYRIADNDATNLHQRIPVWNASISKQFLAVNRGQLKLSVNDILDKNIQISRTAFSGYIEERKIMGLQRFAMLSFTYNLTKTGLGQGGSSRIMR